MPSASDDSPLSSGSGSRSDRWTGWDLTPFRVTLLYFAFGFAALAFSDVVLVAYLSDPLLGRVQAVKGAVEVLLTGVLIYGLTYASRARLAATNDELNRRREELRVLHRVLRHNLRNDLNVIEGYAEQLETRVDADTEQSMCERILSECDDLIRYTEQAARIRQLSADGNDRETVDAVDVVETVIEDHPLVTDDVEVQTSLPETAPVRVNYQFERALSELVTNAVVHAEDDPSVVVSVVPDADPAGTTRIEVSDDGPGIPDHVRRVFADPGDDQLVHLDGLGLWFVYLTVVDSGGEFDVESSPGGGTTVTLRVPTPTTPVASMVGRG